MDVINPASSDNKLEVEEGSNGTRFVKIGDVELVVNRQDPYGFWTIKGKRGRVADSLKGNYTSIDFAIAAIKSHYR